MSNEELALAIQSGETERMGELWEQVEKFIAWNAQRVMPTLGESPTIEVSDLVQSGYFALVAAVKSYNAAGGPFLKWLKLYLKSAFAETAGYRTSTARNAPLRWAVSLDQPIGEDGHSILGELLPDPKATATLDTIEDCLYNKHLHDALETALDSIPIQHSEVIRMRYYQGKTLGDISQEKSISKEWVRKLETKGLRLLKESKHACYLYPFYEFDFYCGTGLQTFKNRGMSLQEHYLIVMEERRRKITALQRAEHEKILAQILSSKQALNYAGNLPFNR